MLTFHKPTNSSIAGKIFSACRLMKAKTKKTGVDKKDHSVSYNKFKTFHGKQYSGMKIGRSHKWYYDQGVWKETKQTPDQWKIEYNVTKRRAGKAPEGSGAPVGTEYNWYILALQHVKKLDANSYTTELSGQKFKLAHKRFDSEKWSASDKAQKRKLIKILQNLIAELEREEELPEEKKIKRVATPLTKEKKKKVAAKKKSRAKVKEKEMELELEAA